MTDSLDDDGALLGRLADAARGPALRYFRLSDLEAENKRAVGFDPVTIADREIEQVLRGMLAQARPADGVLGEEFGRQDGASGRLWVLDPIDGTRAYISGLPTWGVLIALHDGARPVLGAMDQPFTGERFIGDLRGPAPRAWWERGAERRDLRTRRCAGLSAATLFTTDPGLFDAAERAAFDRAAAAARLTRYGVDCYAYAMLAAGQVDLVIESGLSAYDVQALIPLIEGAGGIVTDWRGGDPSWGGALLAAGDARLHAEALKLLAS